MPKSPSCKHLTMKKKSIWASSKAKPLLSRIRFTQEPHGNFPERCCVISGMLPSMPCKGLTPGRTGSRNGSGRSQERRGLERQRSQLTRLTHFSSILLCLSLGTVSWKVHK